MSTGATLSARPRSISSVPGRWIVHDPEQGEWLALEQASVAGAVIWLVASHHADRAAAEHAAGFHDSPVIAWMLHDPALGWRRSTARSWAHSPGAGTQFDRASAEAIAAAEPGLQLLVVRANRLITCPDIQEGS